MSGQSDLWKELGNEFGQLAHEEIEKAKDFGNEFRQPEPHNRSLRALLHDHLLHAYYNYSKHPETGKWWLNGGAFAVRENLLERFRALAARAGAALGPPKDTDPEDFWLDQLRRDLREHHSLLFLKGDDLTGRIVRVFAASATFCARLERKAVGVTAPAGQRMISAPAKAKAPLTDRTTQDRDKAEMARLLKQSPSEYMRNLLVPLTENEANVARLCWEYKWPVAKIARSMNKHRTTIDETRSRAKAKMNSHFVRGSKASAAATSYADAKTVENERIEKIDAQRHKKKADTLK